LSGVFVTPKALLAVGLALCALSRGEAASWVQSWGAAPLRNIFPESENVLKGTRAQTLRERIRISVGGEQLRVRLSNEFGRQSLRIGAASIAISKPGGEIDPRSLRPLTFGGLNSVTIPRGAPALSDPVGLNVDALSELTVSFFLPEATPIETVHYSYGHAKDNLVSKEGNFTLAERMPVARDTIARAFLTGVDVLTANLTNVVVALGDSITDGFNADTGGAMSWPDRLAERAAGATGTATHFTIVNQGANGNFVLRDDEGWGGPSALARFDRDVLAVPGITHVVILEGTNDIIEPGAPDHAGSESESLPSAATIIQAYQQLIARAHGRGLKIYGGTLIPFKATNTVGRGYYTPAKEALRQTINGWIRESGAFDAVIDFDHALRSPADPTALVSEYASGDGLHPSAAGYRAMAGAVESNLFR
jgi:lysophospholipase L1-like esterase